ncbi:MAG: hypothetical protein H6766_04905 [Candidatus Peribacteria bacterium]|nr:MAG: hypothetical protein H6766_04905 [Candidatus Peribacteria bacterium]
MYLGLEKNINHQSLRKSLGNEAAHYIGGVVHTSIFATTLSAHWSKDKLESMEAKKDAIYE